MGSVHSNDTQGIPSHENGNNSNDFNIHEEEWNNINQDSHSFQDFINVDENLTSMAITDIETVFKMQQLKNEKIIVMKLIL